jgi:hypothetical protein
VLVEQGVAEAAGRIGPYRRHCGVLVELLGEDVGTEAGDLRMAAQPRRRHHLQGRAAELDGVPALAGEHRPS